MSIKYESLLSFCGFVAYLIEWKFLVYQKRLRYEIQPCDVCRYVYWHKVLGSANWILVKRIVFRVHHIWWLLRVFSVIFFAFLGGYPTLFFRHISFFHLVFQEDERYVYHTSVISLQLSLYILCALRGDLNVGRFRSSVFSLVRALANCERER